MNSFAVAIFTRDTKQQEHSYTCTVQIYAKCMTAVGIWTANPDDCHCSMGLDFISKDASVIEYS